MGWELNGRSGRSWIFKTTRDWGSAGRGQRHCSRVFDNLQSYLKFEEVDHPRRETS